MAQEQERAGREGDVWEDVYPTPNSLVLFMSQGLPHEVLPTACVRRAVVGWFRVRERDRDKKGRQC